MKRTFIPGVRKAGAVLAADIRMYEGGESLRRYANHARLRRFNCYHGLRRDRPLVWQQLVSALTPGCHGPRFIAAIQRSETFPDTASGRRAACEWTYVEAVRLNASEAV
jgi:hypothetical protein